MLVLSFPSLLFENTFSFSSITIDHFWYFLHSLRLWLKILLSLPSLPSQNSSFFHFLQFYDQNCSFFFLQHYLKTSFSTISKFLLLPLPSVSSQTRSIFSFLQYHHKPAPSFHSFITVSKLLLLSHSSMLSQESSIFSFLQYYLEIAPFPFISIISNQIIFFLPSVLSENCSFFSSSQDWQYIFFHLPLLQFLHVA